MGATRDPVSVAARAVPGHAADAVGVGRGRAAAPVTAGAGARALALLVAAVLGVLYALILGGAFGVDHLRNDATQYVTVARHLQAGDGPLTNLQTYPAQQTAPPPVVQRVWPPGYPLALAAVSSALGVPAERVAAPFALWCVFMVGALILLIGRDAGLPWPAAAGAALVWLALPEPFEVAGGGQSESLFALFVTAGLAVLVWRGRSPARIGWAGAAFAGACFAAAFMTRYNGVAFVAALAALSVLTLGVHRRPHPLVLVGLLPAAVVAVQLASNWLATGSVRAGSHRSGEFVAGEFVSGVQYGLRSLLGLESNWPAPVPAMLALAALVGWLLLAGIGHARRAWRERRLGGLVALAADWPLAWVCAALVAALTAMHLLFTITGGRTYPFESRYLVGALPAALIAMAVWVNACLSRRGGAGARVLFGLVVLAWGAALVMSWRDRGLPDAPPPRPEFAVLREALAQPVDGGTLAQWLRARTDANHGLLAADGQVLGMLLARPVAALTEPAYSHTVWTEDAARALGCRVGARWLVVFPALLPAQARTRPPADVIARIARGDTPADWPVVLEASGVRILAVCN